MRQLSFVFVLFVVFCVTPVWAETQGADTDFTAAVIKEQNVTFAVVFVKNSVLDDKKTADSVIEILEPSFGGIPVILMVQDSAGRSSYYGRQDIVVIIHKRNCCHFLGEPTIATDLRAWCRARQEKVALSYI